MIFLIIISSLFFLFREMSEHSKDNKWKWEFLNNREKWRNKHNWKPSWFFKSVGVAFTDPEHAFQLLSELSLLGLIFLIGGIWPAAAFAIGWCIQHMVKEVTNLS